VRLLISYIVSHPLVRATFCDLSYWYRSALLEYNKELQYGDMRASRHGLAWLKGKTMEAMFVAAALLPPSLRRYVVPQAGEGPDRETMERGYMTLHARGVVVAEDVDDNAADEQKKTKVLVGKFHFNKDIAYLYTAALLVETGLLLLETRDSKSGGSGGVLTPAAALGSQLTQRILEKLDASLEIEELDEQERGEAKEEE